MYSYGLSPREAEVLAFVRNNVPTSRIAAELGISLVTVKTYIHLIISKLEVYNLSALARIYRVSRTLVLHPQELGS